LADVPATPDQNLKITQLGTLLDSRATHPFRDAAAWNYCVSHEGAQSLKKIALQNSKSEYDPSAIEKIASESVYSIDLDKLSRLTFPQDDAIHVLEWPIPIISPARRAFLELEFVRKLESRGEDISGYWQSRTDAGLYRHLRMWLFYKTHSSTYPDPDNAYATHHLASAMQYAAKKRGLDSNLQHPLRQKDGELIKNIISML